MRPSEHHEPHFRMYCYSVEPIFLDSQSPFNTRRVTSSPLVRAPHSERVLLTRETLTVSAGRSSLP